MNCIACNAEMVIKSKIRKNNYHSCQCKECKWQHTYWIGKDLVPKLSWIGMRFAHEGTTWHATHKPHLDQTTYVKVERSDRTDLTATRQSHTLPAFVDKERFIALLPFL